MQDIWNEHCLMIMQGKHRVGQTARQQLWAESDKSTVMLSELPHLRPDWAASILHQPCSLRASSKLSEMLSLIDCLDHVGSEKREGKWRWESDAVKVGGGSRLWFRVASALGRKNSPESVTWETWSSMSATGGEAVVASLCHCPPLCLGWAACWSPPVLWSVSCFFDVPFFVCMNSRHSLL